MLSEVPHRGSSQFPQSYLTILLKPITVSRFYAEKCCLQNILHIDEQAGAELSQAQPKLRFRLRLNDFQIWRYGWLDKLTNLSMYEV